MKKIYLFVVAVLGLSVSVQAQTNIQEMYDFNRDQMTTTLEMFKADNWGSTFFFVDIYHKFDKAAPTDFYVEISRSLNFWKGTALNDFNLHAEWNGGCGIFPVLTGFGGYPVNNAWLFGAEYFIHSKDYRNTLTLQLLYKDIRKGTSEIPLQFTAVWGMNDLFNVKGLVFSGFADFWWENQTLENPEWNKLTLAQQALALVSGKPLPTVNTTCVFITEPQLWYNIGQHFNCDNLFIGGEVEISSNFSGATVEKGWKVNPAAGVKWNF